MNLLNLFKRPQPPVEVIQAACSVYGLSSERVHEVQAEKLKALSKNVWVITLNDQARAVVAYEPGAKGQAVAAPWFVE